MNKVFVFDLGNVIVIPMNIKMLYEKLECEVSYEEFINFFKNDKSVIDAHMGLISDDEHIEKLLEFSKSLYKDTTEIIEKLKENNYKVCMLSNLRKIDFEWFCSVYDISKFDELFLSYEMKINKPDKRIYIEMIEKLKVNADQIYFFDDSKQNIDSAKEIGINAYCVTGDTIRETFEKEIKL